MRCGKPRLPSERQWAGEAWHWGQFCSSAWPAPIWDWDWGVPAVWLSVAVTSPCALRRRASLGAVKVQTGLAGSHRLSTSLRVHSQHGPFLH